MSAIIRIRDKSPSILVFGDIMLDEFIIGRVDRISPEAPVPVVVEHNNLMTLGGCGNVIRNLLNIGVNIGLISAIGDDITGEAIKRKLTESDIGTDGLLKCHGIQSTRKMRIIADRQHIVRVDWDSSFLNKADYSKLTDTVSKRIKEYDGIIISDYDKGLCKRDIVSFIIDEARRKNIEVFIDPKGEDWDKYCGADLITPNLKEAEIIVNSEIKNEKDVESAGKKICDLYKIKTCVITRGGLGMSVIDGEDCWHIPSTAKEVFDVSGAGDTVMACISSALLSDVDLIQAVTFANNAAGIVVGHVGTAPIGPDELY